mgnify:CR=1 FL=1
MRPGLEALLRTTTFRLGLVQAGVVLAFVVALLLYVYFETAGQLIRDSDVLADQEYASLERAYADRQVGYIKQDFWPSAVRSDPRYKTLLQKIGLPPD